MIKKVIVIFIAFILLYAGLVHLQVFLGRIAGNKRPGNETAEAPSQKVYFFSFTKYSPEGEKELEIEGDSADILSKTVDLMNVVAKAYAQETPVIITADEGYYDKVKETVHLEKNVVATTEDGTRLLTEQLEILPSDKIMETEEPTEVKKDNINVDGLGVRGDSNLKKVKFQKNVKVVVKDPDRENALPTVITCDGPLILDYDKNIAYFHDNVISKDERGTLTADRMDVYYNKANRRVAKIIAFGNVVIENPDGNKTYSEHVIYLAEEGRVILGGDSEALYYEGNSGSVPQELV